MVQRTTPYDYLNYDGLEHYHRTLKAQLDEKFNEINQAIINLQENACKCNIRHGPTLNRPNENLFIGLNYFDTDLNQPIYWDGNQWVDSFGNLADLPHKGTTEERPTTVKLGFIYYNTDLDSIQIFNGTKWSTLCNCDYEDYYHWDNIDQFGNISQTIIDTLNWYNIDNQSINKIDNPNWINY